MGINNWSQLIKECGYEPDLVDLTMFKDCRIAVDMNNMLYAMMSVAIRKVLLKTSLGLDKPNLEDIHRTCMELILNRLTSLRDCGIIPVCVFDGKSNKLKQHARAKRDKVRDQIRVKLAQAEENLYESDPLLRNSSLILEYEKYYRQDVNVPFDFIQSVRDTLQTLGYPVLIADQYGLKTGDAEALCAVLCFPENGYCAAAITSDSDFHVYGGEMSIFDIETQYVNDKKVLVGKVRQCSSILDCLQTNFETFRDLCILMGTDFNPNIRGFGVKRSIKLIQEYGSIEEISNIMDTSTLNYSEVLQVFTSTLVCLDIPTPEFNEELYKENFSEVAALYPGIMGVSREYEVDTEALFALGE